MAHHKQAKKRARQSEIRRQRNMHVKSGVRSVIKRVRNSVDTIGALDSGRQVHPQEVEKLLRSVLDSRSGVYGKSGYAAVVTNADELLNKGRTGKTFNRDMHRRFLVSLAKADLYLAARALDRAASKGVIHKRNAARRVSRLTLLVNGLEG